MRLKAAITKIVAPIFAEHGYTLTDFVQGCYDFYTEDKKQKIRIDIGPYRPVSLRVDYSVIGMFILSNDDFYPEFGLNASYFYKSQEELEFMLTSITEATINNVLPYIERRIQYYLKPTDEMYKLLSEHTIEKAEAFAQKYGLSMEETKANMASLEAILLGLRGDNDLQRKEMFFKNIDEIISLTAYWGEVARRSNEDKSGRWQWIDWSETMDGDPWEKTYYAIQYDQGRICPLSYVIGFWNSHPELYNSHISYLLNT